MNVFHYKLQKELNTIQKDFITKFLKDSLNIERINFEDSEISLAHNEKIEETDFRKKIDQAVFISKNINKEIVFENRPEIQFGKDPQPYLEEIKDVIRVADGFFTFQGGFLRVFHALNRQVKKIADDLQAIEQEYPAVWPIDLYKKINYFFEFPQQVILCCTVKNDYQSRKEFAEKYAKENSYSSVEVNSLFENAKYGLESAVCDCCYYGLTGVKDQENLYYTCYNKVFRNENSQTNQLDRITNFSVRDIMFVGNENFVLEGRQVLIEKLSEFLNSLQLNCKIESANDPFFTNQAAMKTVFQNSSSLKYELLAEIPHQEKSIAVGSVNYHLDMFSNAFDIQISDGSMAHSGCIGVGMERLAFALYCQHGEKISAWPESVKEFLGLK